MKLTKPQRRILSDAVRDGQTIVGGRNIPAVERLEQAGLITSDYKIVQGGQQTRFEITVRPTPPGKAVLSGEKLDGFIGMHFPNCRYFQSLGHESCDMDCCS